MKRLPVILLLLGATAFFGGLIHLFQLRFDAGDIYPPYSSLRTDPLGAKALYDSFDRLVVVRRNFRPMTKLSEGRDTTLLYLGADWEDLRFDPTEMEALTSFVASGGRLVISLYPSYHESNRGRNSPLSPGSTNRTSSGRAPKKITTGRGKAIAPDEMTSIAQQWGFQSQYRLLPKAEDGQRESARAFLSENPPDAELPEEISCHSAIVFTQLDPQWRTIYSRTNEQAVVIERDLGDGTIVLAADSYLLSNEGLLKERPSTLLAWLIGASRRTVFDETHLGVRESSGVATLLRKYRLHGFFLALLLLAGLFVWKNSTSLVPPAGEARDSAEASSIQGKESAAGFVNLLRRNISRGNILSVCLAEWQKSCSRSHPRPRVQQVQEIVDRENQRPAKNRNPLQVYQHISQILSRKL